MYTNVSYPMVTHVQVTLKPLPTPCQEALWRME